MQKKINLMLLLVWLATTPLVVNATEEALPTDPCLAVHTTEEPSETVTEEPPPTNQEIPQSESIELSDAPEAETQEPIISASETATEEAATLTTNTPTESGIDVTEAPAPKAFPASALLITELYPAPHTGGSEWVELWNATNVTIDLAGWTLTDASGARTALEGSVDSETYTLVSDPKGKLNNGGDTISLFDPANSEIDTVTYEKGIEHGEVYARDGDAWSISVTATPLGPNFIAGETANESEPTETEDKIAETVSDSTDQTTDESTASDDGEETEIVVVTTTPIATHIMTEPDTSEKESSSKKSPSNDSIYEFTLAEAREQKTGTVVRTRGVVSVPPGIVGSRTFYIAGSGMQVYLHSIEVPELALGDILELQAKLGSSGGEARLVVSSDDWLRVVGTGPPPNPELVEIGAIDDATEGRLVTVGGVIAQKLPDRFIIEDDSGSVPVVPKEATHIDQSVLTVGDTIQVTGVVSETSSGFRLLPRSADDLTITATSAPTDVDGGIQISMLTVLAGALTSTLLVMVVRKQVVTRRGAKPMNQPLIM